MRQRNDPARLQHLALSRIKLLGRNTAEFWRACRYLAPHRKIVAISVVCAVLVGLTFASGLGALLPILRILVNGDTMQGWVQRQAVENRLGVKLAEDAGDVHVVSVPHPHGPAGAAGVKGGDVLRLADGDERQTLEALATRADIHITAINARGKQDLTIAAPANPWYLRYGLAFASRLP